MKQRYKIPKKAFLLFVSLIMVQFIFAQGKTIKGTVIDGSNSEPIPGVTIVVKGSSSIGTITQYDGKYTLEVPEGATTLVYSFVGMISQEIEIGANSTIDVILEEDVLGLDEIVIIGYGEVKKGDATGSITSVSTEDFNKGSITSPQELLMGRTAGVQITSNSGAPGENATIRIRGGSSLSASNDPLIVIDGVPLDNESVAGMRNPLNAINPNDIESFTVLKDASATAIYGSRASNGVIIITTKKSRMGSPLKINYSTKLSINTVAKTTEVLSTEDFIATIQDRVATGAISDTNAVNLFGNTSTNWQEQIYETAIGYDHNINFTGSYMNLPYRASIGYSDMDGILKGDNIKRITGAVSLNPSFLNDHLKVNVNAKGMKVDNTFADRGAIGSAISMDPTQPVYDETSPFAGYWAWRNDSIPTSFATSNPAAQLALKEDISDAKRFIGNIQFDYKFPFLPDLKANLNMGYDGSSSEGTNITSSLASWEYSTVDTIDGGNKSLYEQNKKNEILDFYFNYVKDLSDYSSKIDATAGYSWQHFWRKGFDVSTNLYTDESRKILTSENYYATESYLVSFFGRLNYTFMDRYLFTFTVRRDGSSRFSPDTRWGTFPSMAFAWKIKEESFLKNIDLISDLKLRLGHGTTGQQNINQGDYPYLARYVYSNGLAMQILGNDTIVTARPDAYDANLKWEETTTSNIGLDFGIFDDRLIGSFDLYYKETKDLLNEIVVPAGTNFKNRILTNVGNLENKGVELSLTGRPIVTKDFFWELNFNMSYNKNEITKLTRVSDSTFIGINTGGISGDVGRNIQIHSENYPSSSFFVFEQVYDQNGQPIEGVYVDRNDDGVIDDLDLYRYKSPAPDYTFGFGSRVEYKNFDFSFNGRINIGNYVYNNVFSNNAFYSRMYETQGYLQNSNTNVLETNFEQPQYRSDYYVRNGSFLRLDNITAGYLFENIAMNKLNIYLSATVQNVFVVTKYEGIDPEINNGIDNNIYPRPRTFIFSINVDF